MAKILLLEDNEDQREIRTLLLEAQGHTIVETIVEGQADLVLMDLRIPTLEDGLDQIRAINYGSPETKIIVLSGHTAELKDKEESRMVHAILDKPCPSGKLLKTIQSLLTLLIFAFSLQAGAPKNWKDHAPILFERADTIGKNSDVPLLMYTEWHESERALTYTVIFSNEDGGTSTRSLMARWGRTTDIEYLYKVWLDANNQPTRREIQTKDHKDVAYTGPFEGLHPLLEPVTRNNMVAPATAPQGKRVTLDPILVDLTNHAREYVMDLHPELAKTAREELIRENKIRPYGVVRGEDISDPNNYAYLEFESTQRDGGRVAWGLQSKSMPYVHMSHLGVPGNTVERSGWVRLALELKPGTKINDIQTVILACYGKGACDIQRIAFLEVAGQRKPVELKSKQLIPAGQQWFTKLR